VAGETVMCTFTNFQSVEPLILTVNTVSSYDGALKGILAGAIGSDRAWVTGSAASLALVREICMESKWAATVDVINGSSVGILWNGQLLGAWSWSFHEVTKPKKNLYFNKLYTETVGWMECKAGTMASFPAFFAGKFSNPVFPDGPLALTSLDGAVVNLKHSVTFFIGLSSGQFLSLEQVVGKAGPGSYFWAKNNTCTQYVFPLSSQSTCGQLQPPREPVSK